jgi:osmotically-inducible protein OsmY
LNAPDAALYFYDGHVSVAIRDGVVTLSGMVFDEWDLRAARRIAKQERNERS